MAEARDVGEPLEAGAEAEGQVAVAGRLVARRGQGKTVFADIEDRSGTIQAWATLDRLGEQGLGVLADAHVGDIIGVRGTVVRTRRTLLIMHRYNGYGFKQVGEKIFLVTE